jgi:hypothetical protein
MLIQVRFLKVRGGQKEAVFDAVESLESLRQSEADPVGRGAEHGRRIGLDGCESA